MTEVIDRSPVTGLSSELRKFGRLATVFTLGALATSGVANQFGSEQQIGDYTFRTHATTGTGASLRVGPEAVRVDTGLPLELGVSADLIDAGHFVSLDAALQNIGDTGVAAQKAAENTYENLLIWGGVGGMGLLASQEALLGLLAGSRRKQQRVFIAASALAACGGLVSGAGPSQEMLTRQWHPIHTIIDGVDLNGTYVSGTYSTEVIRRLKEQNAYYDKIASRVSDALTSVHEEDLSAGRDQVALFTTDWHCRIGIARVFGAARKAVDAKVVLDAGDITTSGFREEEICIDSYQQRLGIDAAVQNIAVLGNHDSSQTASQLTRGGSKVLANEPLDVDNLRIFGDSDPRRSEFGQPNQLRNPDETTPDYVRRIIEKTCEVQPSILLVHDGKPVAEKIANCSPYTTVLSGHYHATAESSDHRWYQGGTSGGAAENEQSVLGTLSTTASFALIYYNTKIEPSRVSGIRTITIDPSGQINVGSFEETVYPSLPSDPVTAKPPIRLGQF